jgi:hypothetical protein
VARSTRPGETETIHAPLFWRERSLLSVTDTGRGKRGDDPPYADLRRIARAKTYERLTIIPSRQQRKRANQVERALAPSNRTRWGGSRKVSGLDNPLSELLCDHDPGACGGHALGDGDTNRLGLSEAGGSTQARLKEQVK